ncbi:MAG: hypothetical protein ACOX63_01055 [Christensenellales bacterium]
MLLALAAVMPGGAVPWPADAAVSGMALAAGGAPVSGIAPEAAVPARGAASSS